MLKQLGIGGVVGVLVMLAGIALIAWENYVIAAGLALTIAGVGVLVRSLIQGFLQSMGIGNML